MIAVKTFECADPDICSKRKIDIILYLLNIGSEIFFELLCIGQIKPVGTQAIWQKTVFGWILSGRVIDEQVKRDNSCMMATTICNDTLQKQVKQF